MKLGKILQMKTQQQKKTILDEDTDPFIDKELSRKEDINSNDRDFPPNEIEVSTVGENEEKNY